MRDALKKKDAKGLITVKLLSRIFTQMDNKNSNRKLDGDELLSGLKSNGGIKLSKAEADALVKNFDRDGDGEIDLQEFLIGVRGKMNGKRQAMAEKVFNSVDKNGSGNIDADDLYGYYNPQSNPKFVAG